MLPIETALLHEFALGWLSNAFGLSGCRFEQVCDEGYLVQNAWLMVGKAAFLDGAMGLDSLQCVLGRCQFSEASFGSDELFQRCAARLDPVVEIFSFDVADPVIGPAAKVHFLDHFCIAVRLVGNNG